MGYKTIINDTYEGMVYSNEIFTSIEVGDRIKGYIKYIREDGKIDITLQPIGKTFSDDVNTKKIIDTLKQNNNDLPYNYKTDSDVIKEMFEMSKKAYKRALTKLVSDNIIKLDENGMELI
jgi:predicted RNA-binding protein (virulence factor B family)